MSKQTTTTRRGFLGSVAALAALAATGPAVMAAESPAADAYRSPVDPVAQAALDSFRRGLTTWDQIRSVCDGSSSPEVEMVKQAWADGYNRGYFVGRTGSENRQTHHQSMQSLIAACTLLGCELRYEDDGRHGVRLFHQDALGGWWLTIPQGVPWEEIVQSWRDKHIEARAASYRGTEV